MAIGNREIQPISIREILVIATLLIGGALIAGGYCDLYDTGTPVKYILVGLDIGLSTVLFTLILASFGVPRDVRLGASLWAMLPWNTVYLSQLAYIGYFFIPIEIAISAILLEWKSSFGFRRAIFTATVVRLIISFTVQSHFLKLEIWYYLKLLTT